MVLLDPKSNNQKDYAAQAQYYLALALANQFEYFQRNEPFIDVIPGIYKEIDIYEAKIDAIRRIKGQIATAYNIAYKEGLEEGTKEKTQSIAKNLLDTLDVATIAQITELTIEEVEELKKQK